MLRWLATHADALAIIATVIGAACALHRTIVKRTTVDVKWKTKVNKDRKRFRKFMTEVRADIKTLLRLVNPAVARQSPIRLTELGKKVSYEAGGQAWADETARTLYNNLMGKRAPEIQRFCFDYVEDGKNFPAGMEFLIADVAYENGIGPDQVLAIELRDALIQLVKPPEPTLPPVDPQTEKS